VISEFKAIEGMTYTHVRGAKSFLDLRTVDGVIYDTFCKAANQRDLLESNKHYDYCLKEALFWMTSRALRNLFASILVHNSQQMISLAAESTKRI
jgi:hypothetical protein